MQLHTTPDGQEHEMSIVSYPTWSSSTSHAQRADPSADGKHNNWWPSQAYHCTFCPRVFRTAQALGGHMNIHRRERAFANDAGTHFHTRRRDSQVTDSTLAKSCSLPSSVASQHRSSLFGGSKHQLLMNHTPPAPSTVSCTENCYASRRIPPAPDSTAHLVTTANFLTPIQAADMAYHRIGHSGRDGAKSDESSGHNVSDPLSWLFSQLPPPGSVTTLQRHQEQQQEQQQQQQQCRGSNILLQKHLAKPYHRALAVRQRVAHPLAPFSEQTPQARGRSEAGGSCNGDREDAGEDLDLELRL